MSIFSFIKSAISDAGVGTRDLGLEQQLNYVPATIYSSRRNVQRSLGPTAPGYAKFGNAVVPVSILGDSGLGLQGTLQLTPLAEGKER